jgi:hypothetical protein
MYAGDPFVGKWRLNVERSRFDGVVYPGTLDGHDLVFTAKKIDENSYNVLISDRVNGKATQVFHYTLSSDNKTLTFAWIKGSAEKPVVHWALLYDRE